MQTNHGSAEMRLLQSAPKNAGCPTLQASTQSLRLTQARCVIRQESKTKHIAERNTSGRWTSGNQNETMEKIGA